MNEEKSREHQSLKKQVVIHPVGDRIMIAPDPVVELTRGGIIIPEVAQDRPQKGYVIAVGFGRWLESGTLVENDCKKGDRVLFGKYAGTEMRINGQDVYLIRNADLFAVLENDSPEDV